MILSQIEKCIRKEIPILHKVQSAFCLYFPKQPKWQTEKKKIEIILD